MRRFFLALVLFALTGLWAFAQERADSLSATPEQPFRQTFSVEAGTGVGPWHMRIIYMSPSYVRRRELAQYGQDADMDSAFYPEAGLSFVWRKKERLEHVFTAGVSWCHHKLIQYEPFGTDPNGNPRYDLNRGTPIGWADSTPFTSFTWQARFLYNPQAKVQLYSGIGLGVITNWHGAFPLPALTLIAARYTTPHFYVFFEVPLSDIALFAHGGLGWKF